MGEDNLKEIPQIPVDAVQPAAEEKSVQQELERVRSSGKVYKIIAVALGIIFIALAAGGYVVYRKISQAKALMEAVSSGFAPLGQGIPTGQRISGEGEADEAGLPTDSSGTVAQQLSGLGFLSMPAADSVDQASPEAIDAAKKRAETGLRLMRKYSQRPVLKEFLAELQGDPAFAEVKNDPVALFGAMRKSKNGKAIMMKYVQRPDFMKVLLEMTNDPELRQFSGVAPGSAGVPAMPPVSRAAQPAALPEGGGEDGDISFDASAISGTAQAQPARVVKTPPAIDSGK